MSATHCASSSCPRFTTLIIEEVDHIRWFGQMKSCLALTFVPDFDREGGMRAQMQR